MAARGESLIAVSDASTWTKNGGSALPLLGVSDAKPDEFPLWDDQSLRGANDLPSKDDNAIVTSFRWTLYSDVVAELVTGIVTGDFGALSIVGKLKGGSNTKCTWTASNMRAGPLISVSLPGNAKEAPRLVWGRLFTPTKESVFTGPTEAA